MSSQATKPSKPARPGSATPFSSKQVSSSVSSHVAMVELKQRILTSITRLADRDTYRIATEDLENIVQSLSSETLPMFLHCLYDSLNDPKPAVKKECLRLLFVVCHFHADLSASHLAKIVAHIVKRLKDADSGVKDACRDAIGALSAQYLNESEENSASGGSLVGLFARPLFEAMTEQNKGLQSGAAMCMAKMVESAADPPVVAFQKMCPRICKLLHNPNFLAKASLLQVVGSLSQVGAIAPQILDSLLNSIQECLGSTDWATRKAASDALIALALHSSSLVAEKAGSILTVLEACRFDKIKPVRDSMTEALNLWKRIAGGDDDEGPEDQKASKPERNGFKSPGERGPLARDSCNGSSLRSDSDGKGKASSIPEKMVLMLKKKAPALTNKELNPEFFHQLETRGSGELPVEVVVSSNCRSSSRSINKNEPEAAALHAYQHDNGSLVRDRSTEERVKWMEMTNRASDNDRNNINHGEISASPAGFSTTHGQSEVSFMNNRGNWASIQRQLLQLERQQAHLMNVLQDFMGGSHDNMVTLQNRIRGLERVVEDMARDFSITSGKRSNFTIEFEGSSRASTRYNYSEYFSAKYKPWFLFGERLPQSWRTDVSDDMDFHPYGDSRNGQVAPRRAHGLADSASIKSEHEAEHISSTRRAWKKGTGPIRFGEGPSARSVWQASKDVATLEAIRVAGEDAGSARVGRVAVPQAEALEDGNPGEEQDPVWMSWSNAMRALKVGDVDCAYAEVLSLGDDFLLVKLMERTGPVFNHLSNGTANATLQAIAQLLLEKNLLDICLSWILQMLETIGDGPDALGIPMDLKKEILLNLYEASTTTALPDDWQGPTPEQLLMQLASGWGIELRHSD